MTPHKKKAPAGRPSNRGCDTNPYQEIGTVMKTTAPRIAHTPDNEEFATSGDSVLVPCDDQACAYFEVGHHAYAPDPLFMHRHLGVAEAEFRVAIERLSIGEVWGLGVEVLDEDMTPEQARRFARALVVASDITDALNAERTDTL